ncbi:hypothetical protein MSj_01076 [Microcystis aeruginosa Sj]|uniref:Uncharacterized protein n=1 Tax=Microcystis aeruginosa Sj TaxID=1979544 RepID=A0A2Z6UHG7_MICAE|nr:hypothetical protein MSj_01076 [Microcystis aeruginosa Sj]
MEDKSGNSVKEVIKIHICLDLWVERELLSKPEIEKVLQEQYGSISFMQVSNHTYP